MPYLELFDETLDINSTEIYELSVEMSQASLSFAILDTIRNKYIMLRSSEPDENKNFTAENIDGIITGDDFLRKKYKRVNVVVSSPKFTLVPTPLFDPAKKEEYYKLNFNREENEVILANKIPDPDAYIIFSMPAAFYDLIGQSYPGNYLSHHIKPLLNQVSYKSKSADRKYIHLHIERDYFNLMIMDNNVLKFSNTFNYRNISDILYYVLRVYKGMDISHDETIHFSGMIENSDNLYSNFAIYLRDLKFTGPSGNFSFSYVFNDIDLHRYINLFSITNCES